MEIIDMDDLEGHGQPVRSFLYDCTSTILATAEFLVLCRKTLTFWSDVRSVWPCREIALLLVLLSVIFCGMLFLSPNQQCVSTWASRTRYLVADKFITRYYYYRHCHRISMISSSSMPRNLAFPRRYKFYEEVSTTTPTTGQFSMSTEVRCWQVCSHAVCGNENRGGKLIDEQRRTSG